MKIITRRVDALRDYEKNARTHSDTQIDQILQSIKNFGFNDPVEIDENDVILSGHGRVLAAKKLGLEEIPTVCHAHLSDAERRAYILATNRIAQNAGWSPGLLKDEFTTLKQDDFDLSLTGFSDDEIYGFMNPEEINDGLVDADSAPGVSDSVVSCLGDAWLLGAHRLLCGDSTSATDVQRATGDAKPILMVTDPPYGVNYDPEWRETAELGVGKRSKGKVQNDDRVDWAEAYSLFTGDVAYVWHAGKYSNQVAISLENCGFDLISQIIWAKQHFALSRGDYHWQHEPCWYAVRKGKKHNWRGKRDQSTLWEIKNNNSFGNSKAEETWGHGTQKPIECMAKPIENNSRPDEWIYDPFGGSGTTLIACEQLGRKCVMIEIDPKYVDVIVRRWEKFTGKKATLESTGEKFNG